MNIDIEFDNERTPYVIWAVIMLMVIVSVLVWAYNNDMEYVESIEAVRSEIDSEEKKDYMLYINGTKVGIIGQLDLGQLSDTTFTSEMIINNEEKSIHILRK